MCCDPCQSAALNWSQISSHIHWSVNLSGGSNLSWPGRESDFRVAKRLTLNLQRLWCTTLFFFLLQKCSELSTVVGISCRRTLAICEDQVQIKFSQVTSLFTAEVSGYVYYVIFMYKKLNKDFLMLLKLTGQTQMMKPLCVPRGQGWSFCLWRLIGSDSTLQIDLRDRVASTYAVLLNVPIFTPPPPPTDGPSLEWQVHCNRSHVQTDPSCEMSAARW